jgi:Animal haem peroxidase
MSLQNNGFEFHPDWLQRCLNDIYRVINSFVRWYRLPRFIAAINIAVFRDRLREYNLYHTGYGIRSSPKWNAGSERWRSADGSFNSLEQSRMGMAGTRFGRNIPLPEAVPDGDHALLDPSPRLISRELLARREFIPATTLNLLAAAWIQFETHNWFSHGMPGPGREFKIPLPPGDKWPEQVNGCMLIRRTIPDPTFREPWLGATPTFRNFNSHWWDAGQIYGNSRARQLQIRSKKDGRIALGEDGMLPEDPRHRGSVYCTTYLRGNTTQSVKL